MKVLLLFFFLIISCKTNEYRLIGINSKIEEDYYYGESFKVSLIKPSKEEFSKIKDSLKNSLALSDSKTRVKEWKEISELNQEKSDYLLFTLNSKTRVIPEFLEFKFLMDSQSPKRIFSYYKEMISTSSKPTYSGGFVYGFGGAGFVGPNSTYRTIPYDSDGIINIQHGYSFLLEFTSTDLKNSKKLIIKTPQGNLIEFDLQKEP
ncbi:MAG: hypothetical protein SFU98_19440 [Leptospiraceae bacterium]|nr:hypothetical protein [Leptospiraceae bacterium]